MNADEPGTIRAADDQGARDLEDAAKPFFDRPSPEGYLEEWAARLAQPEPVGEAASKSVVLFRLGREWLALPTDVLVEVTDPHPIHSIPHRSGGVLRGLVNIRGQLRLCVSLHELLGVEPWPVAVKAGADPGGLLGRPRMVIIRDRSDQWVFTAEEVVQLLRLAPDALRKMPPAFARASAFSRASFAWSGRSVGLLDERRVLRALAGACQ